MENCDVNNSLNECKIDSLSNRERKKLVKKQKWLEYKPIKRAQERERLKKRKFEAKLNNLKLGPSRKKLKQAKMSTSNCKVSVVIDFSFDDLMNNKDLNKCIQQLGFCYGANRRVSNPVQFYVTGFNGKARNEMEKNEGYTNWDVNFREEHYLDIFKKNVLVYLTSDSNNVLNDIQDNKVYIIGGIVDHNAHKGLCLKTAEEQGIDHARFPIEENVDLKTRKVLAINHVFEILVNVCNGCTWRDALLKVIPERKGCLKKEENSCRKDEPFEAKTEVNKLDSECSLQYDNSAASTEQQKDNSATLAVC